MAGKHARMGGASDYIMRPFAKAPQISSPSAMTTRSSLFENRPLVLKTALLLALASVKLMGDLQVLSVSPSCLEFKPNDSKIVLKPRHGYIPKVLSNTFQGVSGHKAMTVQMDNLCY